jgi:hypothetical protein
MPTPSKHKLEQNNPVFARRALTHLFSEYEHARAERDAAETRLARFAETIQLLIAGLPQLNRDEFSRRFDEVRTGTQNRGGEAFGNVIALFKHDRQKTWTIPEIQTALNKSNAASDPKAIYNAITYLARTGRLMRVSRGRYIITDLGTGIEIDDVDQGTSRVTEHDY